MGGSGRLSREDINVMKRYRPYLPRLEDPKQVTELLRHVHEDLIPRVQGRGGAAAAAARDNPISE